MPRLPDRFDLWVRRARDCPDPARQADYVLGALAVLPEWHFLNVGTRERPLPATIEFEMAHDPPATYLLVFSSPDRVLEIAESRSPDSFSESTPIISIPTEAAFSWCPDLLLDRPGLLVNPGEFAALIPRDQIEAFLPAWQERRARHGQGFWIPNLTTEEEDFWQENGL